VIIDLTRLQSDGLGHRGYQLTDGGWGGDQERDDWVLEKLITRERMNIVPELSPETIAALDEARATLMRQRAATA